MPLMGTPPTAAVSCTANGWPCTTMFGPPAAVSVPPAPDGPPSHAPRMTPPPSPNGKRLPPSVPFPSPGLPPSELAAPTEPVRERAHAGATTASASIKVGHRMKTPYRGMPECVVTHDAGLPRKQVPPAVLAAIENVV